MARAARLLACTSLLFSFAWAPGCGGGGNESDAASPGADGGADTSVDANADAAPECHADLDCNDGLYCNGDEHCMAGVCVSGTPPACADTIDCTRDFCSEDRRACTHQVPDMDADGHGAASCVDGAGVPLGDDCDDTDVNRFPGNPEVCDTGHHDEDCVTTTHGSVDHDSDGFEDATCCNGTDCGTDCDDSNRSINTMASEACDHVDNDCDTHVDESLGVPMYPDADRDGYGDSSMATMIQCGDTVGFAARGGDCDDMRLDRNPGQLEVCDTVDNDCDTTVDENAGAVSWFVDADHDGYGTAGTMTLVQCAPPTGSYSLVSSDCDDTTSSRSPRAPEVCNAIDDDCNGLADFAVMPGDLEDDDHDGIADVDCGGAAGRDCNDRDATALPGANEICNGRDDDCDAHVDEDATSAAFHRDADMDGYGDPGTAVIACSAPSGYVSDATDCDDALAARRPGASETCNATDDDCDRRIDETPADTTCTAPNAVSACTVGVCHVTSCQPGFSDCSLASGCETSTVADDMQCGGCGVACNTNIAQCADSQCVPTTDYAMVGISSRDDSATAVAYHGDAVALGAAFAGPRFGMGCGTHFDAQGVAGAVSLRDDRGRCTAAIAIDGTGDEIVTALEFGTGGELYVALTTTSATLTVGGMAANAGAGAAGRDIVLAELDTSLHAVWVRRFGGMFDDAIVDLALKGTEIWGVGAVRGPVSFGTIMIGATATMDAVVVHVDGTNGNVLHALGSSTTGADGATSVALGGGNVYVVGALVGAGMFGTTSLTAAGPSDGYLWMLSDVDGASIGARAIGGVGTDKATGVAVRSGQIAVTGAFEGTFMVDAIPLTSAGLQDGFVIGLGDDRIATWAHSFGGTSNDSLDDVAVTSSGYPFSIVGTFGGSASVSGGGDAGVTSDGGTDGVWFEINTSGFVGFNVQSFGGTGRDVVHRVAAMPIYGVSYIAFDYTGAWGWGYRETDFPGDGGSEAGWISFGCCGPGTS